ncbi:hypothetical protein ACFY6U_26700 [Streptomyces sp. NPDC013157]|uniref:hypothetical protein n=1 Tax=Streptomyces sp. NPDC013157 TaxID=3364861 RepID=UPI0036B732C2
MVQPIPLSAYAVGNEGLFVACGDEATGLARGPLAAGTRGRDGGRDLGRLADSI